MPWYVWMTAGFVLIIIEMASFTFFFAIIGIAAFLTGLFALFFSDLAAQIGIFAFLLLILLPQIKLIRKKLLPIKGTATNIMGLKGTKITIAKATDPQTGKAETKIYGDVWAVKEKNGLPLKEGDTAKVIEVEGTTLIAKKEE